MEITSCTVCYSQDFRYDDGCCRNICNICNAMQEIADIGITSYVNDPNVNHQRLRSYNLKQKIRLTREQKQILKYEDSLPWELDQLFKWIFDKQVEAMKPFVVNWEYFKKLSEKIWEMYSNATGKNFDITKESLDNIRLQKYPVSWGTKYDPKKGRNLLSRASLEFAKYKRDLLGSESNSDVDYDKLDMNAKKVRVERMITMKRLEKMVDKKGDEKEKSFVNGIEELIIEEVPENESFKNEKIEMKTEEILNEEICCSLDTSSDEESALSDEEDYNFQLDPINEKEKHIVRALRKKKAQDVMWTGSYYTNDAQYMESNIAMLFLTLYYSSDKKVECFCLMDILRLVKAKIIPYIRIRRFIPRDLFCINDYTYHKYVLRDHTPSWNTMVTVFNRVYRDMRLSYLLEIDLETLIRRFIKDLNLPSGLYYIINHIRKETKHINDLNIGAMKNSIIIRTNYQNMGRKYPYTLLPEPFCIAHIFVAIKFLLKLDAQYEIKVSDHVKKLEQLSAIEPGRLFIWTDWWKEMYKFPSISNCKTWENLEKVQDSLSFLEGNDLTDNYEKYTEIGLEENEELNHRGRFVISGRKHTYQNVLDDLENPFREIFQTVKDLVDKKVIQRDFTECDVEYLMNPNEFLESFTTTPILSSQDQENPHSIIEELVKLITKNNLSYQRISLKHPDFDDNIFHKNFTSNTTEIENDLLRILIFNSGLRNQDVLHYVGILEKNLFDKSKIIRKRKMAK